MDASNSLQATVLHPRDPGAATTERLWPSDPSRSSTDLPQAAWARQASPRLVSSFQLVDEQQWDATEFLSHDAIPGHDGEDRGPIDNMTYLLEHMGWLPKPGKSFNILGYFPCLISLTLLHVAVVAPKVARVAGAPEEHDDFQKLEHVDSLARHSLLFLAHVCMYFRGGVKLNEAFRAADFAIPPGHMWLLFMSLVVYWGFDCYLLYLRSEEYVWRRILIMVGRLPTAVSVMVMMGIPTTICLDLKRVDAALEMGNILEAQRLYCIFWKHLRIARKWYNAIMTPNFLAAIARLPVGWYALTHGDIGMTWRFEFFLLIFRSVLDLMQLLIWIQPTITIRGNHGVVLSLAVQKAGQQTPKARELATMMASLHPLVGLKFLGFIVTWRLVAQVATLLPILLSMLTSFVQSKW